jgi:hypothetical protein
MEKKYVLLIALAFVALLVGAFFLGVGGLLFSTVYTPCSTGTLNVSGVPVNYEACPGIGISTNSGDTDRYCTLQDVQLTNEGSLKGGLYSEGGSYSCGGGGVPISMKLVFDIKSSDLEKVDFNGFISGVVGTNNKIYSSDSYYTIGFGNTELGGVAIHTEGRSTQSGETGKSFSSTDLSLIKTSNGWLFKDAEGRTNTVSGLVDGKLYISFYELGQRYASGNVNFDFSKIIFTKNVLPIPDKPSASSFQLTLQKLGSWFSNLLSDLRSVFAFSIAGTQNVTPGNTETYTINLAAPSSIDSDYSDGSLQVRYCNVGLVDSSGAVISEKGPVECNGDFITTYSIKIPANFNNNAIVAIMTQSSGTYDFNTKSWSWTAEEVIAKEAYSLNTKQSIPVSPIPHRFSFFTDIWNWIKRLFGGA